jgi:hypothetical protein
VQDVQRALYIVQCALYKLHSVCNVHVGRIVSHQLEKWSLSTGINSRPQTIKAEPVFLNVYGAQESIPKKEFRQPM